jgi:hypothetical protein
LKDRKPPRRSIGADLTTTTADPIIDIASTIRRPFRSLRRTTAATGIQFQSINPDLAIPEQLRVGVPERPALQLAEVPLVPDQAYAPAIGLGEEVE